MGFGGSGGNGSISGASDAALNNPANNHVLTYDSAISKWKNAVSPSAAVSSVAGRTGAVVLSKADVNLGNIDNTSDLNKPISTTQQAALDDKAPIAGSTITVHGNVARPTSRSDVSVIWIHTSQPDQINLNADIWLNIEEE